MIMGFFSLLLFTHLTNLRAELAFSRLMYKRLLKVPTRTSHDGLPGPQTLHQLAGALLEFAYPCIPKPFYEPYNQRVAAHLGSLERNLGHGEVSGRLAAGTGFGALGVVGEVGV